MIITFSGKSCSGKSSLATYLCSLNEQAVHLSIDEVGHSVSDDEIVRQTISKALNIPLSELTRKKLGDAVFNNQRKMKVLTDITWQKMEKKIDDFIETNSGKIIILDWILIPKTKYFKIADVNILIKSDLETRVNRASVRDSITKAKFLERESSSIEYFEDRFDYVVVNDYLDKSRREMERIYEESIVSRKF